MTNDNAAILISLSNIQGKLDRIYAMTQRKLNGDLGTLPALEDETPMCRVDLEELIDDANRFRGDRPGGALLKSVETYELVVSRAELVVFATEIRRCWQYIDHLERRLGLDDAEPRP